MCWYCGAPITAAEPIGRSLVCESCGKYIRSCKNCRFFLPGSSRDCGESQAEAPVDREGANFCDWFSLNPRLRLSGPGQKREMEKASSARSAFDDLFSPHG